MKDADQKVEITILNWDKYQPEMKGDGSRRRRRSFVAISVDLYSDPDFLAMDQLHRNAWVAMLCHAGKVGPRYKLCPSDARLLFRLRRSPDFEVFKNQGFIDLQTPTNRQTRQTVQTDSKPGANRAPQKDEPDVDGLNLEAWQMWVDYRRKAKLKKYTTDLKAKELAALPHDAQLECVKHSIGNQYTGLFPDKFSGKPKHKPTYREQLEAQRASSK